MSPQSIKISMRLCLTFEDNQLLVLQQVDEAQVDEEVFLTMFFIMGEDLSTQI